jgi:hypothetical protein
MVRSPDVTTCPSVVQRSNIPVAILGKTVAGGVGNVLTALISARMFPLSFHLLSVWQKD